jgi:hypothetical protein
MLHPRQSLRAPLGTHHTGIILNSRKIANIYPLPPPGTQIPTVCISAHIFIYIYLYLPSPRQVRYSPDARLFASGCKGGLVKVWDAVSNRCINTFNGAHGGAPVSSVRVSAWLCGLSFFLSFFVCVCVYYLLGFLNIVYMCVCVCRFFNGFSQYTR